MATILWNIVPWYLGTSDKGTAAYIDGWLHVLKADRKLVVTAAAQAQKAADHILGRTFGQVEA